MGTGVDVSSWRAGNPILDKPSKVGITGRPIQDLFDVDPRRVVVGKLSAKVTTDASRGWVALRIKV